MHALGMLFLLALLGAGGWHLSDRWRGFVFAVEYNCRDYDWRQSNGEPCPEFLWMRTIKYRVDVAGNRVVGFPQDGDWWNPYPRTFGSCSVYNIDNWRCEENGVFTTAIGGRYKRILAFGGHETFGSMRLLDRLYFWAEIPPAGPV